MGEAEGGECYHDTTGFLFELSSFPIEDEVDKLMCFAGGTTCGLDQFESLFQKAMVAFCLIRGNFLAEALQ
ncbi:hypothetical protein PJE062_2532 [Pseudovibrio sp. JE062]|nr:hypothetical protein PJE062_2532 [Pseudovibrio sp. JE062]